jgi:hypothetical protein
LKILLISSYELGHQPFHVASGAATLRSAGHEVRVRDLAIEELTTSDIEWPEGVALAVPMHTAMQIALEAAGQITAVRPEVPVCFFGLYAHMAEFPGDMTTLAGEYEPDLLRWADGAREESPVNVDRAAITVAPDRSDLHGLGSYVRLEIAGTQRVVGSTAASRGCRYLCRHCPVPVVYGGSFRVVDRRLVAEDIDAQVALGAEHISFSDPDFLNGPTHALRILEETNERHPSLTFDATVKVEHLLAHQRLLPRMGELGLVFVVSAFETTNDEILQRLDKGHTAAGMEEAVHLLRGSAIDVRPTWLPFTPWTTLTDLVDMLRFLETHDIDVDPIQLTIRLLVPKGSLLLDLPKNEFTPGTFDSDLLSYTWKSVDPRLDNLQQRLMRIMESTDGRSRREFLDAATGEILEAAGLPEDAIRLTDGEGRPRLTEPWFC